MLDVLGASMKKADSVAKNRISPCRLPLCQAQRELAVFKLVDLFAPGLSLLQNLGILLGRGLAFRDFNHDIIRCCEFGFKFGHSRLFGFGLLFSF